MTPPAPSGASGAALSQALHSLSESLALEEREVAAIVEAAVAEAYRRFVADDPSVRARVDLSQGAYEVFRVDETGGEAPVAVTPGDFARHAAHAAKRAVAERLREHDKDRVMSEASLHRGELVDGIVERPAGPVWYLRIGDLTALLPPEEQMPGERLKPHQHLKVVLLDARRRPRDAVAVVSRAHPQLLRLLLEQEVPEIQRGQVVIRGMVREAGRRSKVAVEAPSGDLDARGACIGPKGIRHRAVTSALGDEQLQIIAWSEDPASYVGNSLAPARVLGVELEEPARTARVIVAPDQLSLAIGRGGENARLAARLTGWRIDIRAAGADQRADADRAAGADHAGRT